MKLKNLNWLIFLGLPLSLSCTSALEKSCKENNWYEYGINVAKQGKRPAADKLVQDCRKKEYHVNEPELDRGFKEGVGQYCRPDGAYNTGKAGEFYNVDLCHGSTTALLKKHAEGVEAFCQASNAYQFGLSGKKYNSICPPKLEQTFLNNYNKGRLIYLKNLIVSKERELQTNNKQLKRYKNELNETEWQLSRVQPRYIKKAEKNYVNGREVVTYNTVEDPITANHRESLSNRIDDLHGNIRELEQKNSKLQSEIEGLKVDRDSLMDASPMES